VEFSTLVHFSKLVSDSTSSERIFRLLGETVVEQCGAFHALIFGVSDNGDFALLSSYGQCDVSPDSIELSGVCTVVELRSAVMKACGARPYRFRALPLISESGLFGSLVVVSAESREPSPEQWGLIEGLTELTAISLNKTYQHQRLQKAFDDLRISQDTLVRTEKSRALGQMSAGIAHDLKNLFNPLLLYSEMLRDSAGDREETLRIAQRMDRILNRGVETVERLRDFSRQTPEESEAVAADLNDLIREALEISKPRLSGIELRSELASPPQVRIRPADCITAIVNLVFNAADAMEGRGVITVRSGTSDDGGFIEVQDDGPGMTPEVKARILEPFFTTKGERGTGLGIPIVNAFTEKHGGKLHIESEPGAGALFRMWFPAA
jgi:signal transduction histidine kinase